MPRTGARLRNRELRVVLDTNALFTGSASYFLRKEVSDLIEQHSGLPDLTIRWCVPEIVRHERQFQMLQEALRLLPSVEKLERILGHNLNITKEILETRVNEVIDRQIEQYRIVIENLSPGEVDWTRLMLDAAYRRPPFQHGEKEKGFRDALILETFVQIASASPTSPATARVVLVSSDQLLRNAAETRLSASTNVHVLESVDALKGLINTLGSTVDEQFIAAIRDKAQHLFYKPSDKNTLYYKASVHAALKEALKEAKLQLPSGAERYTVDEWTINPPRFVSKQGQRIFWSTRFQARLKAVKSPPAVEWQRASIIPTGSIESPTIDSYVLGSTGLSPTVDSLLGPTGPSPTVNSYVLGPTGLSPTANIIGWKSPSTSGWVPAVAGILGGENDQLVGYGTALLDVSWSLAVATSGTLTKPRLESVSYIETVWD